VGDADEAYGQSDHATKQIGPATTKLMGAVHSILIPTDFLSKKEGGLGWEHQPVAAPSCAVSQLLEAASSVYLSHHAAPKPGSSHPQSVGTQHTCLTGVLQAPDICIDLPAANKRRET